ncbi:hypothetical protein CLORY_45470 [Clostridium oryzae]|uniref:Uncharacterized protein n=1 Tax=Clostridium oryzae TaxID=1450648 RepID=A0A1V4I3P8_9CLOT|nr:hypothetical protein CLORY_45470 [Clostridium oryzae]
MSWKRDVGELLCLNICNSIRMFRKYAIIIIEIL